LKLSILLFPALLFFGTLSAVSPPVVFSLSTFIEEFESLNEQYIAAHEDWDAKLRDADSAERRKLRKERPATLFWPRFTELSQTGNGQAKLWLVSNMRAAKVVKSDKRRGALYSLYRDLAKDHSSAPWFGEMLSGLYKSARTLDNETAVGIFETIIAKTKVDETRAGAMYYAGTLLKRSEDEALRKRGEAHYARLEEELPGSAWAKQLVGTRAAERVQVGRQAPNFSGKTIDGFEFDLEDYRGKVVLLDFYGFW
jgi:hypothetical protein